jgi:hypothetical protein
MNEPERWTPPVPPFATTERGEVRRVGVELEMIGPDVAQTAAALRDTIGGELETVSRYESVLHGDPAGPWRIELDFAFLRERGREPVALTEDRSFVGELAEDLVRAGAEAVVPVEIISPPLPIPRLTIVQSVIGDLRRLGARGTRAGLAYAFGMQLNPEMPRCDAQTILAYLRAFLCLHDWLVREGRIDFTRKLTRYVAAFPSAYVRQAVERDYAPDLPTLIDHYLAANPTRNRALDLLPLFTELDAARVRGVVADPRVKARPALHYRLPNCEIDEPDWGIDAVWADWMQVERLAADDARLSQACASYAAFLDQALEPLFGNWAEGVEPWLVPVDGL